MCKSINKKRKTPYNHELKKKKSCAEEARDGAKDESLDNTEESGEEVTTETSEKPAEPQIWKLCKQKYLLIFKLCNECSDQLFNNKKKFSRVNDRLQLAIGFCDACIRINAEVTDLISPKKN